MPSGGGGGVGVGGWGGGCGWRLGATVQESYYFFPFESSMLSNSGSEEDTYIRT